MSQSSEQTTIDVRQIPPRQRHPLIFDTFDKLSSGEGFVLVNDHDPRPLFYQFEAERAGLFAWDKLMDGPEEWRVLITRS